VDVSPQSETSPLNERFDLETIISGLASDLVAVRTGKMTVDAARANAELAKQIFNGVRLVVNVQRTLEGAAKQIEAA
jgi:hypothetical protein